MIMHTARASARTKKGKETHVMLTIVLKKKEKQTHVILTHTHTQRARARDKKGKRTHAMIIATHIAREHAKKKERELTP